MPLRCGAAAKSWSIRSLFSRSTQGESITEDYRSEITLVPQKESSRSAPGTAGPRNFNAADMCFGSCCRKGRVDVIPPR
ncbi:hypothetical protein PMG11_10469 [Penicillium brasilianum]|uniref:Uncharacterized protein n=1 Tax=Penicillium brasilianum TaxID=104259 RepID=A0A0F7TZE2_PENBI|nr:hypothetical protein PMG11_10469 [Penicillium brasilianum]